jgi:hypothetical protein
LTVSIQDLGLAKFNLFRAGMMKQFFLLFAAVSLLTGCSTSMKNTAAGFGLGDRATVPALIKEGSRLTDDPEFGGLLKLEDKKPASVAAINDPTKNLIAGTLIARSDRYCNEFLSSVGSTQRGVNTLTLIADSAFSIAGDVAKSQGTTKRMIGFATGAKGLRGNLNQGLFEGQSSTLIMLAVLKLRSDRKDKLLTDLNTGGRLANMDIGLIIPLIEEYHSTCTVGHGLAEIQKNLATPVTQPAPPTTPQVSPQSNSQPNPQTDPPTNPQS